MAPPPMPPTACLPAHFHRPPCRPDHAPADRSHRFFARERGQSQDMLRNVLLSYGQVRWLLSDSDHA